jgi:uncharacterized protein involved in exopolysaccharide biosynthesis
VATPLTPNPARDEPTASRPLGLPAAPRGDDAEVSLVALLAVVLRHRGLVTATAGVLALIVVGMGLAARRTWSTAATLIPQVRQNQAAGLSGLAAQFGVTLPAAEATQSPGFYADLLVSRTILGAVVDSGIVMPAGRRIAVADLYRVSAPNPALRRELALQALGRNVSSGVSSKTGVVRLQVRAPSAAAAQRLADQILQELARFNLVTRQSQAAAERRFTEKRLVDARGELRDAEARLQYFLQRNRLFESPELRFERDRLQREVQLRQDIYASLAQSFERVRIEEVRDTPVFTVVESPELPVRPDPRGLLRTGILALIGGGILGIVLAFLREFVQSRHGASGADREELDRLLADTRRTAGAPWRLVGRVFATRR